MEFKMFDSNGELTTVLAKVNEGKDADRPRRNDIPEIQVTFNFENKLDKAKLFDEFVGWLADDLLEKMMAGPDGVHW